MNVTVPILVLGILGAGFAVFSVVAGSLSGPKRTLRITAQYADVWNAAGGSPQEVAASSTILDQHCADVGRDPSQIRRSVQFGVGVGDLDQVREMTDGYVKVGVTDFLLIVHGADPVAVGEQLATHLPRLRELG